MTRRFPKQLLLLGVVAAFVAAEPVYKHFSTTPEQWAEQARYKEAVEASKQTGRDLRQKLRVATASPNRPSKAYCSSMVSAYMEIRAEIMTMGLDKQLETAAVDDAYTAYQHQAQKVGCI